MSGDNFSSRPCQDKWACSDNRNGDHSVRNLLSYLLPELPYKVTLKLSLHKLGRNVADRRYSSCNAQSRRYLLHGAESFLRS